MIKWCEPKIGMMIIKRMLTGCWDKVYFTMTTCSLLPKCLHLFLSATQTLAASLVRHRFCVVFSKCLGPKRLICWLLNLKLKCEVNLQVRLPLLIWEWVWRSLICWRHCHYYNSGLGSMRNAQHLAQHLAQHTRGFEFLGCKISNKNGIKRGLSWYCKRTMW